MEVNDSGRNGGRLKCIRRNKERVNLDIIFARDENILALHATEIALWPVDLQGQKTVVR